MGKKDLLLIGLVLLLALGVYLGMEMGKPQVEEDLVVVMVDKQEFARIPLSQPQDLRVEQPSGAVNVVRITPEGAHMLESNCQGHDCILQGPVTRENHEYRPNQAFIICLPNRVTVELQVKTP